MASLVAVRGPVRVTYGDRSVRCSDAGAELEARASCSPTGLNIGELHDT